jgi:YggT family protein
MGLAFSQALLFVIKTIGGLLVGAALLRMLLQAVRADFYNPVCQAIVKITAPLLNPLRRVVPGWRGFDFASLVLALALSTAATFLIGAAFGRFFNIGSVVSWAAVGLVSYVLNIYFFAALVSVVASFIAPFSGHPILLVIYQLLQPLYRVAHRIVPPMGGLDFSPMILMMGSKVLEMLLVQPLASSLRAPVEAVIGL